MADKKTLLILRLEGVLQSWGEYAKWDIRDSATMPTKSGIVGLLGCAMGLERDSLELPALAQAISVAVRADRPGTRLTDFQIVRGYPLLAANGKPRTSGNTIVTTRSYLQDACFTVVIDTTEAWRQRIIASLVDPKWVPYLGRKSCAPSRPIFEAETDAYISLIEAVKGYPMAARSSFPVTYECEAPYQTGASISRPDALVGTNRQFAVRRVWRGVIQEEK